jgi:Zn finger protein HypA/HybF involved in hydrogenase expression
MSREKRSTTSLLRYECLDCGRQVRSDAHPTTCEHCGGDLRNLSLSHE